MSIPSLRASSPRLCCGFDCRVDAKMSPSRRFCLSMQSSQADPESIIGAVGMCMCDGYSHAMVRDISFPPYTHFFCTHMV